MQTLTYSIDPGAPAGVSINTVTGEFLWIPTEDQGPSISFITVRVTDNGVPAASATQTIRVVVNEVNTTPALAPIGNQLVDEGSLLTFVVSASDADLPPQHLYFSIDPGAPAGAGITPDGIFTWTPTEDQGPGSYLITLRVTDDGSPVLSATTVINIVVNEVNSPPLIMPIRDKTVNEGATLLFTVIATDADRPTQTIACSLDAGSPAGATINAASGVFSWTPSAGSAPSTNLVVIRVTDSGQPPLSASKTIHVFVVAAPRLISIATPSMGVVTLTWSSHPGKHYQVQFKDDLSDPTWTNLGPATAATGFSTMATDDGAAGRQRFYRLLQLD